MKGQGGQQGRKTNGVNGGRCWCEATNTHTHTHTQTHTHETADGGRPSLTYCVRTAESECTIPFSLDDGDQRNERRTTSAPIDTHTHTPARTYTHRHTRAHTHTHTRTHWHGQRRRWMRFCWPDGGKWTHRLAGAAAAGATCRPDPPKNPLPSPPAAYLLPLTIDT